MKRYYWEIYKHNSKCTTQWQTVKCLKKPKLIGQDFFLFCCENIIFLKFEFIKFFLFKCSSHGNTGNAPGGMYDELNDFN